MVEPRKDGSNAVRTTLDWCCEVFGWQGGTIHQAREHFAAASTDVQDRLCTSLSMNIRQVSDPSEALWFMQTRNRMRGIVIGGVR